MAQAEEEVSSLLGMQTSSQLLPPLSVKSGKEGSPGQLSPRAGPGGREHHPKVEV